MLINVKYLSSALVVVVIQNMNYNIYSNNNSSGCGKALTAEYKLSGNLSFKLKNAEKAQELMGKLIEQGYNVNFNMNAYRQCQ